MGKTKDNKYQTIFMNIHWYLLVSTVIFLGIFGFAQGAEAADYYVAPNGNATLSNCTNINTPCSASTAMTNAAAGDVVYFRGGTYTLAGPHRSYHGVLEPANGGIAGSPITFQAYPGENPVMDCQVSDAYDNCFSLGTNAKNYITFDGFTLKANSGVKMGGMMVGGQSTPRSSNIIIKNMTFDGGSIVVSSTDNREGLRVEGASYVTVQKNRFYNYLQTNNNHNTSGFKEYNIDNLVMENNEFYNNTVGIFLKRECFNCTLRYNYIYNNCEGVLITPYNAGTEWDCDGLQIYHNAFVNNSCAGLSIYTDHTEQAYADDAQIYNNTFYSSNTSSALFGLTQGRRAIIHSNIFLGGRQKMGFGDSAYFTLQESDYNQFGNLGGFYLFWNTYGSGGTVTYTSLGTWASSSHEIGGGNPDANSLVSDPQFTNGSGNYSLLSDFKLAADSPCKGAGKGGVDIGADIDLVGVNAGQVQPFCGDGSCNGTETCLSCFSDCGTCIDTTPPAISNGSPNGTLSAGTTQTAMSVSTNENAFCRWSNTAGVAYSSMTNTFSTTGGASHSATITGLSNGQTYNRYIRCQNTDGYANTSDYIITFSIASSEEDITPPAAPAGLSVI